MKKGVKTGFSFGLASGIITTLGLIVGLQSGTNSTLAVLGGIITIAVADAFSDSLGIHVSQESNSSSSSNIWSSTISTFLSKFTFALTFVFPVLIFPLNIAVVISIIWGLSILAIFSYRMARARKENPWEAVVEHLTIGVLVIVINHLLGSWISVAFSS